MTRDAEPSAPPPRRRRIPVTNEAGAEHGLVIADASAIAERIDPAKEFVMLELAGARASEARKLDFCAAVARGEVERADSREAACLLLTAAAVVARHTAVSRRLESVGRSFLGKDETTFSEAAAACSVRDFPRFRKMLERRLFVE